MPELPEVETVVRSVAPKLVGRRIERAEFSSPHVVRQDFRELAAHLRGQRVHTLERHGKYMVATLDRGYLVMHLGMTGKLLAGGEPGPYTRAVFELDRGRILFEDIRHFGRIFWSEHLPDSVAGLGPDALSIDVAEFTARLRARHAMIKPLLLDQRFLRGMGNIYADEALFAACIHPRTIASKLRRPRAARLHAAIHDVLERGIRAGGSSISDYVDAEGRRGWFQLEHRVYGREGEHCKVCGGIIRRIVLGSRGTHFCPRCQRM